MRKLIKGYFMSLSMFTVVPMPKNSWDDDAVCYMAMFLPLVGVFVAGLWLLLYFFVQWIFPGGIDGPNLTGALLISLGPYLITGLLHLDGFMDTNDAVLSRRDREEKLRILKDSNAGAYGVIAVIFLILLNFVSIYTLISQGKNIRPLFLAPVFSRGMAGLWVLRANPLPGSSLLAFFKEKGRPGHSYFIVLVLILALGLGYHFCQVPGIATGIAVMLAFNLAAVFVSGNLGGFSGDLSGYCISVSECACALILTLL